MTETTDWMHRLAGVNDNKPTHAQAIAVLKRAFAGMKR